MTAPGPPRIDAHQHFWRYDAVEHGWIDDAMAALRRDFLPGDLAPLMAQAGVDACVTVQVRQTLEETRWLLALADAHPFIAGVVGWVDLQADDVADQVARVGGHPKLVGIRHIVQAEPDDRFLLRADVCRGVGALAAPGLAYDILIYPRHLPVAVDFVARFPDQRFVLDHLAKPQIRAGALDAWARDVERLARAPNVCAKLSGLVTEADRDRWTPDHLRPCLDVAFDCFGPSRLLAGSDWPVCTVAGSYSRTMAVVTEYLAARPAAERDAVLGSNAVEWYGLTVPSA